MRPGTQWLGAVVAMALAAPVAALAGDLPARETAEVRGRWDGQVGVFNPLRLGVAEGLELETHPLVLLVAPHVTARARHLDRGGWSLTGLYSAGVPTGGLRLAAPLGLGGFLTPSCLVRAQEPERGGNCRQPPWVLTLGVGVQASRRWALGARDGVATLTLQADKGLPLTDQTPASLGAWAPVEAQFAPAVGLLRGKAGLAIDQAVAKVLRLRAEANLLYVERQPAFDLSPWFGSVYVGADLGLGEHLRLTAGAMWWNADQHGIETKKTADGFDEVVRVRSNYVWPTLDLLWRW